MPGWIRPRGRLLLPLLLVFMLSKGFSSRADEVDFVRDVRPILERHCYSCHGETKQKSALRLDIRSEALKGGSAFAPAIVPGNAAESPLIQFVNGSDEAMRMPPQGAALSAEEVAVLTRWVDEGAAWPDGVDRAKIEDKRDHWSFKPVHRPAVPVAGDRSWARNSLDRFVVAALEPAGLVPAAEADRVTWFRRVSLDLIGLPPTPEQLDRFENDSRPDAYERVVDELLASPHYGERWGQHWLDVVRYADTHGFEVNTERPNAWPYRDYVIRAFNSDTPYDRFIQEQIAGDALGEDTATGFLITASVLLPGQIGADEPSKRLARQDSLDEIVVNIGQTYLGLSLGCARCHDHKFDPISQREYYSMQAFVAGVEYADREVHTPEAEAVRAKAQVWTDRVSEIDHQLSRFEPVASVLPVTPQKTSAKLNQETFDPVAAKFVRFTIHDANLHPSFGLIEPCIDEFEIFTDEPSAHNVALASHGTRVMASGSRTSDIHRLEHIHDGQYGNSHSWMSDEAGRGWVQFELPEVSRIASIHWSRDREGNFEDRLPIAYTIEAGVSPDALKRLVFVPPARPPVNARMNVDRIIPVKTHRLRFTIEQTNNLEPCLDELEVFDTSGRNVALATAGAHIRSSGDTVVTGNHELRFIHDGQYGNSHSWMSNEPGKGWVELEFEGEPEIERIVWGRDRQGTYTDRLATSYRIEVEEPADTCRTVAGSSDRQKFDAAVKGTKPSPRSTAGLTAEESRIADALQAEKKDLEARIAAAVRQNQVFAGAFRAPDMIRLLNRGDPEQPGDEITPGAPEVLGSLALPQEAKEQQRRLALANWLASPQNPLTARVMVNRIWQGHFGVGLVETSSDFGRNGTKPTHAELLDWLAQEFVRTGWSVKQLHRLITLSATYRQAARWNAAAASKDADVRLLWCYPSRRLEAESLRDSMLAVSGRLNSKMFGRGFDLFDLRGGLSGFKPVESFQGDGLRRMIYAHKVRREREAVFGAFDCPDAGQATSRRRESNTPIQALNLFNSRFTIDESEAFAARVRAEAGHDPQSQVSRAYLLALARLPQPDELADAQTVVTQHGLSTLCRALFNCNEFLFLP